MVRLFLSCFIILSLGYQVNAQDERPLTPPEKELDEVFMVVETMPRFSGCEEMDGTELEKTKCAEKKMLEYIYSTVLYPQEARDAKQEGMFVGQFIVGKDGKIQQIEKIRSTGSEALDLAALEVLNTMSEEIIWIPGRQRGNPVNVKYTLPIRFRLER